jgi:hypothetical protein
VHLPLSSRGRAHSSRSMLWGLRGLRPGRLQWRARMPSWRCRGHGGSARPHAESTQSEGADSPTRHHLPGDGSRRLLRAVARIGCILRRDRGRNRSRSLPAPQPTGAGYNQRGARAFARGLVSGVTDIDPSDVG